MKLDVKHIAKLANLPLQNEEIEKFEGQLKETITYISQLEEVDTKDIQPTYQVTGLSNVLDEDETHVSLTQTQALQNAQSTHNGLFKVKAILEEYES